MRSIIGKKVGFFILTYKTKHNELVSLHELTKQNTLQTGCSFCEIAKNKYIVSKSLSGSEAFPNN